MKRTLPIILLLLAAHLCCAQNVDLKKGIILYYPLDGNATDSGANGFHGELYGNPVPAEDRKNAPGRALHFDGKDDYIVVNGGKGTYPVHTVTGWFRTSTTEFNEVWKTGLIFTSDYNATSNRLGRSSVYVHQRTVRVTGGHPPDGGPRGPYTEVLSRQYIDDGKWHCFAAVFDAGKRRVKLYVDGNLAGDTTGYAEPLNLENKGNPDERVEIGARVKKDEYFNGDIDELRVYARELSPKEIDKLCELKKEVPFADSSLPVDVAFVLPPVRFQQSQSFLQPEAMETLYKLAEVLRQHPDLHLQIDGHTEITGKQNANRILSQERADAVAAYLIGRGIAKERLHTAGYGSTRPAHSNASPWGREMNRRVEFRLFGG